MISSLPYMDVGNTSFYTDDYDEICPYTDSTAPDVVYLFASPVTHAVDITLCQAVTDYDTKMYIYENTCPDSGSPFACNDDSCQSPEFLYDYQSQLENLIFTGGNTYYIVVDGYGGSSGNYQLNISSVGLDCISATTINCGDTVSGNTTGGTNYATIYPCVETWPEFGPEDVYELVLTSNYSSITATLSDMVADLDVFILGGCDENSCVAFGDYSAVHIGAPEIPPGTYYIVVDGFLGTSGTYTLAVDCVPYATPTPPCFNTGDANLDLTITAGDAQRAFEIALEMYIPNYEEACAADCNGDGNVTAGDAQAIFNVVLFGGICTDPL